MYDVQSVSTGSAVAVPAPPLVSLLAGVKFDEEQDMHKQQELMKTVVLRATASTTLMAVVVTVVGAGRKFTG